MNKFLCFFITVFFSMSVAFSQPLSQNSEQRLLSFCKLYSTVKYYYPDPNLQDFPWDAFAYKGYEIAKTSKNDKEFIKKTNSLFRIIAPGVQISKKGFNVGHITPKDTSFYSERAFWQHRGGLNTGYALFSNGSTLNYIYKKSTDNYLLNQTIAAKPKGLRGKKLRFSLLAKVEGNNDSIKVFSYNTSKVGKGAKITGITIKVAGNEWKRYIMEMEHPDSIIFSNLKIYHPQKGTVYLDDLKLERFENENWEEVEIRNAGFESYSSLGHLNGWEEMYAFGTLIIADSINAMEGKYCLKLPAVQENLLYIPAPIDQPHIVSLPEGYRAYIPLQLYADEKTVFPAISREDIKKVISKLQQNSSTTKQLAISCIMQTWAALYHDYSYRENDFENKINRLLFQTINKLNATKAADFYTILVNDFLLWINDPHLRLEGREGRKFLTDSVTRTRMKTANIPVSRPYPVCLTETQCVVTNVIDSVTSLQAGDVILEINGISIDSILQLYRTHNISRFIQLRTLERLITTVEESEIKVRLLRNGETVDVVFPTYTRPKGYSLMSLQKEDREKYKSLQDSLKEATGLFFLNTIYPSDTFNGWLIPELNQSNALILDVRGRPSGSILRFFNEYTGIDLNRKIDILKTAFYPVAQFKRDTLDYVPEIERDEMLIQTPVYVLIDYNTMSATERSLLNLKKSGRATFIGSNTSGAAGFVCKTKIADNITLTYTTGQTVGLDDNPMSYQGTGIAPDIYVYPTPQGIAEGRDEVLEKAVEIALKNMQGE